MPIFLYCSHCTIANELKKTKSEMRIPTTKPGIAGFSAEPGASTHTTMINHGTIPDMQPKINGSMPPPGCSYFSCSQPNRIIDALTPKMAMRAATSEMPTICAIKTIMIDDDREYSTQRK